MSIEHALATVNGALHIGAAVTHKGDELKCYVPSTEESGVDRAYLAVEDCQALADAFGFLAIHLETAQRQGVEQTKGTSK